MGTMTRWKLDVTWRCHRSSVFPAAAGNWRRDENQTNQLETNEETQTRTQHFTTNTPTHHTVCGKELMKGICGGDGGPLFTHCMSDKNVHLTDF